MKTPPLSSPIHANHRQNSHQGKLLLLTDVQDRQLLRLPEVDLPSRRSGFGTTISRHAIGSHSFTCSDHHENCCCVDDNMEKKLSRSMVDVSSQEENPVSERLTFRLAAIDKRPQRPRNTSLLVSRKLTQNYVPQMCGQKDICIPQILEQKDGPHILGENEVQMPQFAGQIKNRQNARQREVYRISGLTDVYPNLGHKNISPAGRSADISPVSGSKVTSTVHESKDVSPVHGSKYISPASGLNVIFTVCGSEDTSPVRGPNSVCPVTRPNDISQVRGSNDCSAVRGQKVIFQIDSPEMPRKTDGDTHTCMPQAKAASLDRPRPYIKSLSQREFSNEEKKHVLTEILLRETVNKSSDRAPISSVPVLPQLSQSVLRNADVFRGDLIKIGGREGMSKSALRIPRSTLTHAFSTPNLSTLPQQDKKLRIRRLWQQAGAKLGVRCSSGEDDEPWVTGPGDLLRPSYTRWQSRRNALADPERMCMAQDVRERIQKEVVSRQRSMVRKVSNYLTLKLNLNLEVDLAAW